MIYLEHLDLDVDSTLGHPDLDLGLLNKVWNGIKSGELKHNQENYHCGSAHCLAGWIVIKQAEKWGYKLTKDEEDLLKNTVIVGSNTKLSQIYTNYIIEEEQKEDFFYMSYWELARIIVGLNSQEALMLFHATSHTIYQDILVQYLNKNKRLKDIGLEYSGREDYLRVYRCEGEGFNFIKHLVENNIRFIFKPYE